MFRVQDPFEACEEVANDLRLICSILYWMFKILGQNIAEVTNKLCSVQFGDSFGAVFVLTALTVFLNSLHSSGVIVSALATRGMMFTLSCNLFINSTSKGFRLEERKQRQGQSSGEMFVEMAFLAKSTHYNT